MEKQNVLFLCTGNSARSQMAEGYLRHVAGDRYAAYSAGTKPSTLNPLADLAMKEIGVDISHQYSKHLDDVVETPMDVVITVCDSAKQACPSFPGTTKQIHWSIDDPAAVSGPFDEKLSAFREIRDEITSRINQWVEHG